MNKKIPKKIFQIKFITAIDQVSISKKFLPTKTRRKRRFHCHILQESLWRIFIRIDFYTIRQKKHLFEMGETCHKLFFCLSSCYLFSLVFFPCHCFLNFIYTFFSLLFNIWANVRWDGEIFCICSNIMKMCLSCKRNFCAR